MKNYLSYLHAAFRFIPTRLLIGISLLTIGLLSWNHKLVPWLFNLEVATTLVAALMSIGCLLHIYQEHQHWLQKEHDLEEEVLQHIVSEYPHLPAKAGMAKYLHQTLEMQSSPEQRLQSLKALSHDKNLQLAFVHEVQAIAAEQDVLETLGLNWQQSSNAKDFEVSA